MTEDDFVDGEVLHINLKKDVVSDIVWTTKDRRKIRLGDMEDKHIRNCALFLINFSYNKCVAPELVRLKWLQVFSMEWQRRMLERQSKTRKFRVYPDPWDNAFDRALDDDLDDLPIGLLND
jgi:hypothetical protein